MGVYRDHVFPRVMNVAMNTGEIRKTRARVCARLEGEVVEIGFGTGHNLPFLPAAVTRLRVVEPSGLGVRMAQERIVGSPVPVEVAGLDGQNLPFEDASADHVLCTWSLCTIPDPVRAVQEARRVLKPGGGFHFAEHGAAPDAAVRKWQDRLNPVQKRLACGCHLNRDIVAILESGGLRVEQLESYYGKGEPKPWGAMYEGTAIPA